MDRIVVGEQTALWPGHDARNIDLCCRRSARLLLLTHPQLVGDALLRAAAVVEDATAIASNARLSRRSWGPAPNDRTQQAQSCGMFPRRFASCGSDSRN